MKKYEPTSLELDKLILDKENPRFAELYNGSEEEDQIIEYLLYTESADEIAEAISNAGEFYDDRPLWVYKNGEKYIVKDGNRRCSAVKALQLPNKFGLNLKKFEVNELPVLIYKDIGDLETRIRLEHNSSLFKKWGRIAKALEIYRLFSSGSSINSLTEIDSSPKDFIKTATFYHKAVEIKGEDFKKLVREGRGKTGGKTIVFERLFKSRLKCGYNFKRSTSEIIIKEPELFQSYINAIVPYLIANPDTTSRTIDDKGSDNFLENLRPYGFPPEKVEEEEEKQQTNDQSEDSKSSSSTNHDQNSLSKASPHDSSGNHNESNKDSKKSNSDDLDTDSTSTRHSIKKKPSLKRKQIPNPLKKLIDECYNLDQNNFANAKTALTRVTLECTLKYVVENTNQQNGKFLAENGHFRPAFYRGNGTKLPFTNFEILKTKFTELIIDTGVRKAFEDFDLQRSHQIIHNYRVGAVPADARGLCDNLIDLLEFMLQEESELKNSLDQSRL